MSRKRKRTKTFYDKTIAVFLSLDVQVRDDDRAVLFTLPLIQLIPAMMLLGKVVLWLILIGDLGFRVLDSGCTTLTLWVLGLQRRIDNLRVMLTLAEIGFRSALFGMGVPI